MKKYQVLLYGIVLLTICCCNKHTFHIKGHTSSGFLFDKEYKGDTPLANYEEEVAVYFPTGELNSRYKIVNHMNEGKYLGYFKNGQIHTDKNYLHNKLEGTCKIYYSNGQLEREEHYENNKLNGLIRQYYPNRRLSDIVFFKDSTLTFLIRYDSTGKILINESCPYLKYPKTIHLGEKFKSQFFYPIIKDLTKVEDFNVAIIPVNILNIDSLKNCVLYSKISMKRWTYALYKENKIRIRNYSSLVFPIPLNAEGYGEYEFTPTSLGNYSFKGVSVSYNSVISIIDTAFAQKHFTLDFSVIK